jgi:Hsp70 protein
MYDPLGLSIGTTNLVAVRSGSSPVSRRAVLTLFPDRAPELGVPEKDSADPVDTATLMTGFVERVGGSGTLMSADGSKHDPALLLVEALDVLITETGGDASTSNITIAVPAHWEPQALRKLQDALCTHAGFVRGGRSPRLVADSITALTALNSDDRLPVDGVVALLDFGATGTSITLADAASGFTPIADTVRYPEFSGDLIDEALQVHVLDNVGRSKGIDPASTGAVGQFGDLSEECRRAKERLSDETETELVVELAGQRATVQVSRAELESLIENQLSGVFSAFDDMLRRSRIRRRDVAAVAMAGGCAKIPFVAQRLSAHTKASVVTAVQPGLAMAVGAVMVSARQPIEEEQADGLESTTMAAMVGASTGRFGASSGTFTASTDTLGASTGTFGVPTGGAFLDDPSETMHQLAWSEADDSDDEPVVYTGEPYDDDNRSTPSQLLQLPKFEPPDEPRGGSRLPQLFLGVAALVSMVAIGGVAFSLTSSTSHPAPPAPVPTSTSAAPPPSTAPSATVAPPPVTSEAPPPPPSSEPSAAVAPPVTSEAPPPPPPPPVTKTYQPPPSPTQQATSTTPTATTPSPTPTTTPTTAPPPPPSTTVSTTPSEVMTTTYLKLPFVPVPIPVQVPEGPGATNQQPQSPYQPQNPYQPQSPYQPQYPYGGGYGGGGYGY